MTTSTPIFDAAAGNLLTEIQPSGRKLAQQRLERVVVVMLALIASLTVIVVLAVIGALIPPTFRFFSREVSLGEFFGGTDWFPLFEPPLYGVWSVVLGSFMIMLVAVVIAIPCGLAIAFFLNQYASSRARRILKPFLEILAGVPTVVLGFFAVAFVSPNISSKIWPFGEVNYYNALSAGLVVGLMILPMMTTLAEDAMASVPRGLAEGAFALGATRREVCTSVIFPASLSGVTAAAVIAMSRALGETTIVLLAAGTQAKFTANLGDGMQTMASFIGFAGIGDQPTDSPGYRTIFAVGSVLFVITFILNVFSNKIVRKFREVYE